MTEEDTFNALRRIPYTEMHRKLNATPAQILLRLRGGPVQEEQDEKLCNAYGWTLRDFRDEGTRRRRL